MAINKNIKTRTVINLENEYKAAIDVLAKLDGRSTSNYISMLIKTHVDNVIFSHPEVFGEEILKNITYDKDIAQTSINSVTKSTSNL